VKRLSRILSSERNESSLALTRLQREKENLVKMVDALQADLEDKRDEILRLHKQVNGLQVEVIAVKEENYQMRMRAEVQGVPYTYMSPDPRGTTIEGKISSIKKHSAALELKKTTITMKRDLRELKEFMLTSLQTLSDA
jgi:predicted  nucleic acid-binding Zn-ribbon protein